MILFKGGKYDQMYLKWLPAKKKSFYKTENVHVHTRIWLCSGSEPLYRSMYNSFTSAGLYIELVNFDFPEGNKKCLNRSCVHTSKYWMYACSLVRFPLQYGVLPVFSKMGRAHVYGALCMQCLHSFWVSETLFRDDVSADFCGLCLKPLKYDLLFRTLCVPWSHVEVVAPVFLNSKSSQFAT